MEIKLKLGKYLIQNLLYPAVLGSFLIDLIGKFDSLNDFSQNVNWFSIKILLAFSIIIFYCCDYLYSYVTKNYNVFILFCDLLVMLSLIVSFNSININELDSPNLYFLIIPFLGFLLLFFCYDKYKIKKLKKLNDKETEISFYKILIQWQIWTGIPLFILLLMTFCNSDIIHNTIIPILFLITLFCSSYFYLKQVKKKYSFRK